MSLTVRELLDRRIFEGLQPAAGRNGLHREVSWVNIMEILDVPDSVAPGELLFTTGFGLQNEPQSRTVIRRLSERGVAGMVIQTGYYLEEIPGFILSQADQYDFPLLTIPREYTFSAILHTMMQVLPVPDRSGETESLQPVIRFVRDCIAQNGDLFRREEEPEKKPGRLLTRLMLLEPVDHQYNDSPQWEKTTDQVASYLQACSVHFYTAAVSGSRQVYLLSAEPKDGHSLIYGLNIRLALLAEQGCVSCFMGSVDITPDSDPDLSVRRAGEAIGALHDIQARRGICPWEQIKFIRLLGHMHKFDHSAVLDNRPLQQLLDYDRKNGTAYAQTLRVYLSNNCGISQTAGFLYIHRHTLLKRLEKIAEISGLNLDDWYTRVYMSINLLFHDYFIY